MAARVTEPPDFDEGGALRRIRETLEDPHEILEGIGAMLVAESRKAFREEKMGDQRWQERINPNFPGVISDLTFGATIKERRFQARPVLHDTGRLKQSVAWRVVSTDTVEVGSNLPYAGPLHAGEETETLPITKQVQQRLGKILKAKRTTRRRTSTAAHDRRAARVAAKAGLQHDPRYQQIVSEMRGIIEDYSNNGKASGIKGAMKKRYAYLGRRKMHRRAQIELDTRGTRAALTPSQIASQSRASASFDKYQQLAWMMNEKFTDQTLKIQHPARPIVGLPPQLVEDVQEILGVKIGAV